MTDVVWTEVLDQFEARLDAQATALEMGAAGDLHPFTPPASIAPLPRDLADRATELTQRCRRIEDDLARALAAAGAALDRATPKPTAPANPVYFDSHI